MTGSEAEKPRLMTRDEIIHASGYIWKEFKGIRPMAAVLIEFGFERSPFVSDIAVENLNFRTYGEFWRCWTACPSEEQRDEAAWRE